MIVYLLLGLIIIVVALWWFRTLSPKEFSTTYKIVLIAIFIASVIGLVFTKFFGWLVPLFFSAMTFFRRAMFLKSLADNLKGMAGGMGGDNNVAKSDAMTLEKAYDILGLDGNATVDDVMANHRALVKKVHPDMGGNAFLVQQVNDAKDMLVEHLSNQGDNA